MTFNETAVVVLGLMAGYWIIDAVLNKTPRPQADQAGPSGAGEQTDSYQHYIADNWHTILGVPSDASAEQITTAYQQLSEQYHPDRVAHQGAEFRELAAFKMRQLGDARDFALARPR